MKKLIITVLATLSMGCVFADTVTDYNNLVVATDVYDFKASLKVPCLNNGIRSVSSQTLKGNLYMEYNAFGDVASAYIKAVNTKTKVEHLIKMNEGDFVRIGKSNKYAEHSVSAVSFNGNDIPSNSMNSGHEFMTSITLCGFGSLAATKFVGCTVCGGTASEYCTYLNKASGNVVGIMDCMCSDDDDWNHTVHATRCKEGMRQHEAPFYGSWSVSYNKKLSNEIKILENSVPAKID